MSTPEDVSIRVGETEQTSDSLGAWSMSEAQVRDQLAALARDPDKGFEQGQTGLCGKMAVMHGVYTKDPGAVLNRFDQTLRAPHRKTPSSIRKKLLSRQRKRKVGNALALATAADLSSASTRFLTGYRAAKFSSSPVDAIKGGSSLKLIRKMMSTDFGLQNVRTLRPSSRRGAFERMLKRFNKRFSYRDTVATASVNAVKFEYSDEPEAQRQLRETLNEYFENGGLNMSNARSLWNDGHRMSALAVGAVSIPMTIAKAPVKLYAKASGYPHAVDIRSRILPVTNAKGDVVTSNGEALREFVGYNSGTGKTRLYRMTMSELKQTFNTLTVGDVARDAAKNPEQEQRSEKQLLDTYRASYGGKYA